MEFYHTSPMVNYDRSTKLIPKSYNTSSEEKTSVDLFIKYIRSDNKARHKVNRILPKYLNKDEAELEAKQAHNRKIMNKI